MMGKGAYALPTLRSEQPMKRRLTLCRILYTIICLQVKGVGGRSKIPFSAEDEEIEEEFFDGDDVDDPFR